MRLSLKSFVLVAVICFLHSVGVAQKTITVKGVIFKKGLTDRVSQALVNDLNNKVLMMSDELGMFSINVSIGDTLLITKVAMAPLKVVVNDNKDIVVYMQPVLALKEVTIVDDSKKKELNDAMRGYKSQGIFNDGKSLPFWTFVNSPITGLYNLFGKKPAEARRFAAEAKLELEGDAVNKRYTKELVKIVTKLPDDEVPKFMLFYAPSYQDIKEWNDYQLITAIKKNFVYYQRTKNHQQPQLQKLN